MCAPHALFHEFVITVKIKRKYGTYILHCIHFLPKKIRRKKRLFELLFCNSCACFTILNGIIKCGSYSPLFFLQNYVRTAVFALYCRFIVSRIQFTVALIQKFTPSPGAVPRNPRCHNTDKTSIVSSVRNALRHNFYTCKSYKIPFPLLHIYA